MESGNVDAPATVRLRKSGSANPLRERFVPIQARTFKGFSYRTAKVSGSGGLRVEFWSNGQKATEIVIPDPGNNFTTTSTILSSQGVLRWVEAELPVAVTFAPGQLNYVFIVAEGSSVWAHAPSRNMREWGWISPAVFTESYAEHFQGSWIGTRFWDYNTNNGAQNYNWPIALHLVP